MKHSFSTLMILTSHIHTNVFGDLYVRIPENMILLTSPSSCVITLHYIGQFLANKRENPCHSLLCVTCNKLNEVNVASFQLNCSIYINLHSIYCHQSAIDVTINYFFFCEYKNPTSPIVVHFPPWLSSI